jgi:hypothetical protein
VPRTAYAEKTATRLAYGNAVAALGKVDSRVVALDGDVKNSTYHDKFFAAIPDRSIQVYIAEQNMVGIAVGLAVKGFIPFAATFAAFITRAHDQVRMAAYSFANIKVCGSHAGVSIGEDGPSQMGLEDLAMFRPVPGCVVLYPADASAAEGCVATAADHQGMVYIRTTRPATALLYGRDEPFPAGGSKVLRRSERDEAVIIAAGITVHEALQAAGELAGMGRPSGSSTPTRSSRSTWGRFWRRPRKPAARSSSSRTITRPAGWGRPSPRRWPGGRRSRTFVCASSRGPENLRSCSTPTASARSTSSRRSSHFAARYDRDARSCVPQRASRTF